MELISTIDKCWQVFQAAGWSEGTGYGKYDHLPPLTKIACIDCLHVALCVERCKVDTGQLSMHGDIVKQALSTSRQDISLHAQRYEYVSVPML